MGTSSSLRLASVCGNEQLFVASGRDSVRCLGIGLRFLSDLSVAETVSRDGGLAGI